MATAKLSGDYVDPNLGKLTFGDFSARARAQKVNQRPSTQVRDDWTFRLLILPHFQDLRLQTIDLAEIQGWISSLNSHYSPASTRKAVQLAAWVMQQAVKGHLVARSPFQLLERGDLPKLEDHEQRFLNHQEIESVAGAIDPLYRPLVLTAGFSGLRFGELAALRVKHLNMLGRAIHVEEGMVDVRGHISFGPLKTKAARRIVSIPPFLVEVLAEHLAGRDLGPDDLVFVGDKGAALRASNFRRRFWMPAVEASVGFPCRFHDLRHSHAALLIRADIGPKVIQKRLGHASIRTTFDIYGHIFDGMDQAAADALEVVWNKSSNGTFPGRGANSDPSEEAPASRI